MPFFDKDKLDVTIRTDVDTLIAGDVLSGSVHIDVHTEVECTAVRLEVSCHEYAEVHYYAGKRRRTATQTHDHFFQRKVLTGRFKVDGKKGGCVLAPGSSEYPFQIAIPATIPPTHRMNLGSDKLIVGLYVCVIVDIPHGFDKTVRHEVNVLPALPRDLYARSRALTVPIGDCTAKIYKCSCCCCFCCNRKGSSVKLSASVMPPFLLLPTAGDGQPPSQHVYEPSNDFFGQPPANTYTTRVMCRITNNSTKTAINALSFSLVKCQSVTARGHRARGEYQMIRREINFADSPIVPCSTREFGVLLQLPETFDLYKDCPNTFYTGATTLKLVVDTAGGMVLDHAIKCDNAIYVVAALDASNRVPTPPFVYNESIVVNEHPAVE